MHSELKLSGPEAQSVIVTQRDESLLRQQQEEKITEVLEMDSELSPIHAAPESSREIKLKPYKPKTKSAGTQTEI